MAQILLDIPSEEYRDIWAHLLPERFTVEEAAFMYVRQSSKGKVNLFRYLDWYAVPPDGFLSRSEYHFELTDATRAAVIKRAHDLNASLVELHSHDKHLPVKFSPTDFLGFQDFVPHVWWRLKRQPYIAVVVSHAGFDGLVWMESPDSPLCLDGITIETAVLKSTGYSFKRRRDYYG